MGSKPSWPFSVLECFRDAQDCKDLFKHTFETRSGLGKITSMFLAWKNRDYLRREFLRLNQEAMIIHRYFNVSSHYFTSVLILCLESKLLSKDSPKRHKPNMQRWENINIELNKVWSRPRRPVINKILASLGILLGSHGLIPLPYLRSRPICHNSYANLKKYHYQKLRTISYGCFGN